MPRTGESAITDGRLRALYIYWQERRGDRAMPAREDIDPVDIPHLLPIIGITDVVEGGKRYRYRLLGTEIVRCFGMDATGCYADEVLPAGSYAEHILGLLREVTQERRALYSECIYLGEDSISQRVRRLIMPLSVDGNNVDMTFSGQVAVFPNAHEDTPDRWRSGVMSEITRVMLD